MDPISNTDRIIAILRQRLRERSASAGKAAGEGARRAPTPAGLAALGALTGADRAQLRRACIQALLADQLGRGLLNDAQFQQVVTRVVETIGEDPVALDLLDRVVDELRAG